MCADDAKRGDAGVLTSLDQGGIRCATITRLTGAKVALILGALSLLLPGNAVAAQKTKILVESTGGQPNAGEPELWTGTVLRDGPRAPQVPSAGT